MSEREDVEIARNAKDIINQLAVFIRNAHVHDPGNVAVVSAIEKFISTVNPLIDQGNTLTLELVGEFFYLNESRVRYSMEYLLNFDFLVREFKRRGLGSITLNSQITLQDMQLFLKPFIASTFSQNPFD